MRHFGLRDAPIPLESSAKGLPSASQAPFPAQHFGRPLSLLGEKSPPLPPEVSGARSPAEVS